MRTRSQTKNFEEKKKKNIEFEEERENSVLYMVEIDFNNASIHWRANKKSVENGCYKYICCQKTKLGNQCKRESVPGGDYCKIHNKK